MATNTPCLDDSAVLPLDQSETPNTKNGGKYRICDKELSEAVMFPKHLPLAEDLSASDCLLTKSVSAESSSHNDNSDCFHGLSWFTRLFPRRRQPVLTRNTSVNGAKTNQISLVSEDTSHRHYTLATSRGNSFIDTEPNGQQDQPVQDMPTNLLGIDPLSVDHRTTTKPDTLPSNASDESLFQGIMLGNKVPGCSLASLTVTTQEELEDFSDTDCEEGQTAELSPESIENLHYCPRILTRSMIQQIHQQLPDALQMNRWDRCFTIGLQGDSFLSLLDAAASYTYSVVVIRTTKGHILGGFASRPWKAREQDKRSYYGTGQSFLFCTHPDVEEPTEQEKDASLLKFYKWTGTNDYCQICDVEQQVICMGGQGDFGWRVQENFEIGQTGYSMTYGNPPLVPSGFFEVAEFEVYGLAPALFFDSPPSAVSSSLVTKSSLNLTRAGM